MANRLYLYQPSQQRIMVSRSETLDWQPLGATPPCKGPGVFTAGGGRLFLWDSASGQLWTSPAGRLGWKQLDQLNNVACLAVGGRFLYALDAATGEIRSTLTYKAAWRSLGQTQNAAGMTADGKTLYLYGRPDSKVTFSGPATTRWRVLGPFKGTYLTVCGRRMFLYDPEAGQVLFSRRR